MIFVIYVIFCKVYIRKFWFNNCPPTTNPCYAPDKEKKEKQKKETAYWRPEGDKRTFYIVEKEIQILKNIMKPAVKTPNSK